MKLGIRTLVTAGLLAGGLGIGGIATTASAMPSLSGSVAHQDGAPANIENVYCGYYGCYHRRYYRYGYYRPYRYYRPYGYYHPYYGPHIGIGIGGVGIY